MLAPNNSLKFRYGIKNYDQWCIWAFKRSIEPEDGESEAVWAERIVHTTEALLEQRDYIEEIDGYSKAEKDRERKKINNRLTNIFDSLGCLPSFEHSVGSFDATKDELKSSGLYITKSSERSINNLSKLIDRLLDKRRINSAQDLWSYLQQMQGVHAEKLVYIYSAAGNQPDSVLEWSKSNNDPISTITKKQLGAKLSIRKKNKKIIKEQ